MQRAKLLPRGMLGEVAGARDTFRTTAATTAFQALLAYDKFILRS